tara:strand:- start:3907 stop:4371 length:465 start_codon:yes stop_codon:yes gene_type:complete
MKKGNAMTDSTASNIYQVSCDYDQKIKDAVDAGDYPCTCIEITEDYFPRTRSGKADIEIELVHFDRVIGSDEVIDELESCGLRPCELSELAALGAQYPDLQRELQIVALGSVWCDEQGNRNVPFLGMYGTERLLNLIWSDPDWLESYHFAAVSN